MHLPVCFVLLYLTGVLAVKPTQTNQPMDDDRVSISSDETEAQILEDKPEEASDDDSLSGQNLLPQNNPANSTDQPPADEEMPPECSTGPGDGILSKQELKQRKTVAKYDRICKDFATLTARFNDVRGDVMALRDEAELHHRTTVECDNYHTALEEARAFRDEQAVAINRLVHERNAARMRRQVSTANACTQTETSAFSTRVLIDLDTRVTFYRRREHAPDVDIVRELAPNPSEVREQRALQTEMEARQPPAEPTAEETAAELRLAELGRRVGPRQGQHPNRPPPHAHFRNTAARISRPRVTRNTSRRRSRSPRARH